MSLFVLNKATVITLLVLPFQFALATGNSCGSIFSKSFSLQQQLRLFNQASSPDGVYKFYQAIIASPHSYWGKEFISYESRILRKAFNDNGLGEKKSTWKKLDYDYFSILQLSVMVKLLEKHVGNYDLQKEDFYLHLMNGVFAQDGGRSVVFKLESEKLKNNINNIRKWYELYPKILDLLTKVDPILMFDIRYPKQKLYGLIARRWFMVQKLDSIESENVVSLFKAVRSLNDQINNFKLLSASELLQLQKKGNQQLAESLVEQAIRIAKVKNSNIRMELLYRAHREEALLLLKNLKLSEENLDKYKKQDIFIF